MNTKINPHTHLFGNIISTIDTLDNADKYAECNFGSDVVGYHSVTHEGNADVIAKYLIDHNVTTHCDIGASRAVLSEKLLNMGIDSYAIDGCDYGIRNNLIKVPLDRYAVFDITSCSVEKYDLYKKFHFTTAFEITEHIKPELINVFYDNMKYMSNEHFCSCHVGGDDHNTNSYSNHYLIRDIDWWKSFLSQYGTIELCEPAINKLVMFDESYLIHIKFKD